MFLDKMVACIKRERDVLDGASKQNSRWTPRLIDLGGIFAVAASSRGKHSKSRGVTHPPPQLGKKYVYGKTSMGII